MITPRGKLPRYFTAVVDFQLDAIDEVQETPLEVKYSYYKGFPETLSSPAELNCVEVVGVWYDNRDVSQLLSTYDYELIEDELLEWHRT